MRPRRPGLTRRTWLKGGAAAAATFAFAPPARALTATVLETRVISHQHDLYHGWPTLARRKNNELLLVYSGGREDHVCPFGRVELMRSSDGGETWTFPRVLHDGPIDDRDAGVLETAKGSLLVTTFTSLAYEPLLDKMEGQKRTRWTAAHARVDAPQRSQALDTWMLRSTDGGVTFSAPYRVPLNSPHGPAQLADGRLLYAGKALWEPGTRVGVCVSDDDGESWEWLADIPAREGDRHEDYHELHAAETQDGKLVVHIRNHNPANQGETLQCESTDGGSTWTTPHPIGVWGLPSHLLALRDGRLLMTYGHRRKPFGNQARVSTDGGDTWSDPLAISTDGSGGDLGYPSTAELDDGSLVTVWYERMDGNPRAVLRQAKWRLA